VKPSSVLRTFALLLSPFAPHMAEEVWERLGGTGTLAFETWPEWDEKWLISDAITIAIQVNGKHRGNIEVPTESIQNKVYILEQAKSEPGVAKYVAEGELVKEIYVPGKIVNLVVK
jgi:leucyl-tRNA synthetase